MSNIDIPRSTVIERNLNALRSRVEGTNLVLEGDGDNYVERFAPAVMDGNDTMEALYGTEKDEIAALHDEIMLTAQNAYIKTMNIRHVRLWESILKLEPSAQSSIEERKQNIINKMWWRPPYTRNNFYDFLYSMFGAGNWAFLLPGERLPDGSSVPDYTLIIDVAESDVKKYMKFQTAIRNIVPANLYLVFSLQYTHLFLEHGNIYGFRYSDVEQFSYGELSKYASIDEE